MTITAQDGKTYRITGSVIPAGSKFDAIRASFSRRGISDKVNAYPPRCSKTQVQLYVFHDGSARRATIVDTLNIEAAIARETRQ